MSHWIFSKHVPMDLYFLKLRNAFWLSEVLQLEDIFCLEDFLKKQVHFKNQSKQHGWGGSRVWKDEEAETVFISFVSISLSLPSLFTSHTHTTHVQNERERKI